MRKTARFAITAVVLLSMMLTLAVSVCAFDVYDENPETGCSIIIDDGADLFTPAQEKALADGVMREISAAGGVAVVTTEYNNRGSAGDYAEHCYRDFFGTDSGTVFLIDMDTRKIYFFSDGEMYRTLTKSYANTITDNVYRYASEGDYYACAENALEQVASLISGRRITQPMKYAGNALLALTIALLANYIRARFVSEAGKATDREWMQSMKSRFAFDDVSIQKTHTTREYSPQSSSDSGSSDSGGGSSGGGGGHSF